MKWKVNGLVVVFLLVSSSLAYSERINLPLPWIKQTNPYSLGLLVVTGRTCPFERPELLDRLEGDFWRARIDPNKGLSLSLTVVVRCLAVTSGDDELGYAVNYDIFYSTTSPDGALVGYQLPRYGTLITGGKDNNEYYIDNISDDLYLALTDYLQANNKQR